MNASLSLVRNRHTAPGRSVGLWAGVIGAPAVWGIQLQCEYVLAPLLCPRGLQWVLYVLAAVGAVLGLISAGLCLGDWRAAGNDSPDQVDGGPVARTRFLGALGLMVSLIFTLVIVAQGLASIFFDGCWVT